MYLLLLFKGVGVTDYALNHKLIDEKDLDLIEKPPYNLHLSLLSLHLDRNPDALRISNLQKFSILALRMPFLEPVIRWMCELPPNKLFGSVWTVETKCVELFAIQKINSDGNESLSELALSSHAIRAPLHLDGHAA